MYVSSVPTGAQIRVLERKEDEPAADPDDFFLGVGPKMARYKANKDISLKAGDYQVAVALRLTERELRRYPGYAALRRAVGRQGTPGAAHAT